MKFGFLEAKFMSEFRKVRYNRTHDNFLVRQEMITDTQLFAGHESSSCFRDAFSRMMQVTPTLLGCDTLLKASWLDTRLGPMIAIADEHALYFLEFVDQRGWEREVERFRKKTKSAIIAGSTRPIRMIE